MIVTGLDLSLTATGITVIDGSDITTSRARTDSCDDDVRMVRKRIRTAHHLIMQRLPESGLFVIEGPSYNSKFGKPHERAGLWWMVVDSVLTRGEVAVVPPQSRAMYATGSGAANKAAVRAAMRAAFPGVQIPDDNVADSLALALMGSRHLGHLLDGALPKKHLEAMSKVLWPTTKGI